MVNVVMKIALLNNNAGNMGEIIKNLEEISKILEQESCEDAISRKEAKKLAWDLELETCHDNEKVVEMLDDLPSVTLVPKKCHNENHNYAEYGQFVCSNCGIELQDWLRVEHDEDDGYTKYHEYEFNYCPNCGAKIDKHTLKYADQDTLMPAT